MEMSAEQQEHEAVLLEMLAECTRIQGDAGGARAYYEQALTLHQALQATVEIQAMIWIEIGLCWFDEGDLAQAKQYYTRGEECLHEAGLETGFAWAKVRYEQGYAALCEGRYQEVQLLAQEALSIFSRGTENKDRLTSRMTRLQRTLAGDPVDKGRAHTLIGLIAIVTGQAAEALTELLKAYTIYQQHHQIRELAIVCGNLGDLYMRRAAYEQAQEALEEALYLADKMGYAALSNFTTGNLGVVALRQGNLERAEECFVQALNGSTQCNEKASMSFWASYVGEVAIAQGQIEKARRYVAQALVYARQCHFEPYLGKALVIAASLHLTSLLQSPSNTKHRKAPKVLQQALSLNGIEAETRIEARLVAARLAALEGDRAASQAQAHAALDEAQQCGVEWVIPLAREWL